MHLSGVRGQSLLTGAMLLVAVLDVCAAPLRFAQIPSSKIQESKIQQEEGERRLRIELTLDFVEGLVRSLPNEKNRTNQYARLGEIRSRLDPVRARENFREAILDLRKLEAQLDTTSDGPAESVEELQVVRRSILQRAAAVDPELARALIQEERDRLTPASQRPEKTGPLDYRRGDTLIDYAEVLMGTDPQASAALALESLSGGVPSHLASYLSDLHERHPEGAESVFQAALRQATEGNTPNLNTLIALLDYVLRGGGLSGGGASAAVDAATTARLLAALGAALTNAANSMQAGSGDANQLTLGPEDRRDFIQDHLDLFLRYAPDQVPALENAMQRLSGASRGGSPSDAASRQAARTAGSNNGGSTAITGSGRTSDQSLVQAALQASRNGDWVSAQDLTDRVQKAETRGQAKELVSLEFAMSAVRTSDYDGIRQFASTLTDPMHRAEVYAAAAEHLLQQSMKDEALNWIGDALAESAKSPATPRKTRMLLTLLQLSADLGGPRSFELAQAVVSTLNKGDAGNASAGGSTGNAKVTATAGKHSLDSQTIARVSEAALSDDLEAAFTRLGLLDFDNAMLIVSQIENADRRIVAELAVCLGALSGQRPATKPPSA